MSFFPSQYLHVSTDYPLPSDESCTVVRARSNSEPTIIAPPLHSIPLANLRLNTTAINSIFHKRSLLATSVPLPLSPAIINITTAPSSSYTTSQNSTQSVKFNKALS